MRPLSGGEGRVILRSLPLAGGNVEMVASPDGSRIAVLRHTSPAAVHPDVQAIFVMGSTAGTYDGSPLGASRR